MPLGSESLRVVIAGAASVRGMDLKQWLEESGFPAGEIRLVDEDPAAGTLTEVGGEPTVVQSLDSSTFDRARFAFFAGTPGFAALHARTAGRAGATVIDLTRGLAAAPGIRPWVPKLDVVLPPPAGTEEAGAPGVYLSPSAPAIVACALSAGLRELAPRRVAIVFFHPVSERGEAGIQELERQTIKLLSFQPAPQEVFDTQVAFNLVDRWGAASGERLSDVSNAISHEVHAYLAGRAPMPAISLVQAPVFYGHVFSAYVELSDRPDPEEFVPGLERAGFKVAGADEPGISNVTVAGEPHPFITRAAPDSNVDGAYWFWGGADNMRLTTANATRIAEQILAS